MPSSSEDEGTWTTRKRPEEPEGPPKPSDDEHMSKPPKTSDDQRALVYLQKRERAAPQAWSEDVNLGLGKRQRTKKPFPLSDELIEEGIKAGVSIEDIRPNYYAWEQFVCTTDACTR